jgi:hypothetical protein
VLLQTWRAPQPLAAALQHPVVTTPDLGFEEFSEAALGDAGQTP